MNKWHFIAIGAGVALGFLYLGTSATSSTTGTPNTFDNLYQSGVNAAS
jgi:hypothetical protein